LTIGLGATGLLSSAQSGQVFREQALAATVLSARMKAYTDIFRIALLNDNRMCLRGIMTAERDDLPPEVRAEVDRFAEMNVQL
jgi:TetR/AcrR family transcriptional repressor of nem operon